jgi:hypothetical protein
VMNAQGPERSSAMDYAEMPTENGQEAPDRRLAIETRRQLKEAQEMAEHFSKQAEVMRMQAEQCERVVKACRAALDVLEPEQQAPKVAAY